MARKFETDYRVRESDDVLSRLEAIVKSLDLRIDRVEQLGEAFATGNRADVDALVAAINNTIASRRESTSSLSRTR